MTRMQETRVAVPLVMLMLFQPVFGQNNLDLREADARKAADKIISAAKERFDCNFEEYAMQDVGNEPDVRYVFHVSAEGSECRDALVFATNMAARDDKLMFDKCKCRIVGNGQACCGAGNRWHLAIW